MKSDPQDGNKGKLQPTERMCCTMSLLDSLIRNKWGGGILLD
jgi:hypothetical protein